MNFNRVRAPLEINNITLLNRIVFPGFQTNYATIEGFVTERLLKFYESISGGGSGLIITGAMAVSDDGAPNTNVLKINNDKCINGLRKLFNVIKKNGAVPGAQLVHSGRQSHSSMTGHPLVAPSAIPCPVMKEIPLELDKKGIKRIQDDFVQASIRAKKAGAELIELHGAFGYLIGGFLSPFSNKRKDEYGIDRSLFFTEIIEKVKKEVGNMPVSCRISADEFIEGGLTLDDTRKIAPILVDAGADIVSVAAGNYASMDHMATRMDMGEGVHVPLAAAIRKVIDVPVICSDNIRSLGSANSIISEKKADLVAICRPQVADPNFVRKSLNNQSPIECIDCGACFFFLRGEKSVSCPINPVL